MSLNKVLAALLAIIFVIFSLAVILAWSVRGDILNADAYVQALDEADFFEVPYRMIRDGDIPGVGGLLLKRGPLSAVSGADLETVARDLAPPDWLRAQLERAIRDLLAVADTPKLDDLPDLVISLSEVKARTLGEPGDRALAYVLATLPECAPGQPPLSLDKPVCKPADVDLSPFLSQLRGLLVPLVERVPDTYQVHWQPEQRDVLEDLQRAGRALDRLPVVLLLLACLNLALLGLIWVLAVRSPAEWLRWAGGPLLALGLLVLLAAFLGPRVVAWGLDQGDLWAEGRVPARVGQALEEALLDLTLLLFRPALYAGAVLAAVGLPLTLLSPLFPGPRRRSPQLPSYTSQGL
jgi:hypothetical protein